VPASGAQPVSPLSKPGLLSEVATAASKLAAREPPPMTVVVAMLAMASDFRVGA